MPPTIPSTAAENRWPVRAWLDASTQGPALDQLESVYADLRTRTALRRPICRSSGRCCNFDAWGHRLYVTGLEAAYAWVRLERARRPTIEVITSARASGGCPFQSGTLCSIHEIKPLGCRVYFCDQTSDQWQQEVTEQMLARLRAVHESMGLGYIYAEWRELLEALAATPGAADWPTLTSTIGCSSSPLADSGSGGATGSSAGSVGLTIDRRIVDRRSDDPI